MYVCVNLVLCLLFMWYYIKAEQSRKQGRNQSRAAGDTEVDDMLL
jgi:hypothetical protein